MSQAEWPGGGRAVETSAKEWLGGGDRLRPTFSSKVLKWAGVFWGSALWVGGQLREALCQAPEDTSGCSSFFLPEWTLSLRQGPRIL